MLSRNKDIRQKGNCSLGVGGAWERVEEARAVREWESQFRCNDVGEGGMDFMLITCRATNHREGRSEAEQRQSRGGERRREAEREADARRERERGEPHNTTRARSLKGWGPGGGKRPCRTSQGPYSQ
jgi:hypothetical protein